ncbi:MAG: hypothetical protein M3494_13235 [Actinomycetota bacterium]|nr:hypothetical protein [Actinomycetota bacterium]
MSRAGAASRMAAALRDPLIVGRERSSAELEGGRMNRTESASRIAHCHGASPSDGRMNRVEAAPRMGHESLIAAGRGRNFIGRGWSRETRRGRPSDAPQFACRRMGLRCRRGGGRTNRAEVAPRTRHESRVIGRSFTGEVVV